jgi:quercetin dioxygenase-like cupin family protein
MTRDRGPFLDIHSLPEVEKRPGWRGRHVHAATMTMGHREFDAGSEVGEHAHPQEEVWEVIEGELELTVDGATAIARPGLVAVVPPNSPHSVRALSDGKAIVVDHPRRPDF